MLIGAVFFVDFYTEEGYAAWTRVLKDALDDIGLSLTAPSLRVFFSPRLVFRGISWPSSLSIRVQVLLFSSITVLVIQFAQAAFHIVYNKLYHRKWCSWIKPLPQRVKERVAFVTERCLLPVAAVYESRRDGKGTTVEDLKAWARNNPTATKIDLVGLTSLTCDGIVEVMKMLPNVKTPSIGCVRRARSSLATMRAATMRDTVSEVVCAWTGA